MTPIEAQKTHLLCHQLCTRFHEMFYKHSYDNGEYDEVAEELGSAMDGLYRAHEYGHLKSVMDRVTNILAPADYAARRPNIRFDDLVKHLSRFPIAPYASTPFLFGDAELNHLVVTSALKSACFEEATTSSWNEMLKKLAEDGDVQSWMALSEGIFHGSCANAQRISALLSVGCFDDEIIDRHKKDLGGHFQSILDNNQSAISFVTHSEYILRPGVKAYRALKTIGHLALAKEFIDRDMDDNAGKFKIQDFHREFDWSPSESALRTLARARVDLKKSLAHSVAVHLLTLPAMPEGVQFYAWPLEDLAVVLDLDGTSLEFGTLNFIPAQVGLFIEAAVTAKKLHDPYPHLISAGVSERHAMMSTRIRDSRISADLGL